MKMKKWVIGRSEMKTYSTTKFGEGLNFDEADRLEDIRAKRAYDDIVSGKMPTYPSGEIMTALKEKYGF